MGVKFDYQVRLIFFGWNTRRNPKETVFVRLIIYHEYISHVRRAVHSHKCRPVPAGREINMYIEDYIPFGHRNRISRGTLEFLTKNNDRTNRVKIEEALFLRGELIVNIDNGYFRPDGSLSDTQYVKGYLLRESARTSSCSKRCKAIRRCIEGQKPNSNQGYKQINLFDSGMA